MGHDFIFNIILFFSLQLLAVLFLFGGSTLKLTSCILSVLNLANFALNSCYRQIIEYESFFYLGRDVLPFINSVFILTLLLFIELFFRSPKFRNKIPILSFLPVVGVMALSSMRLDLFYISWIFSILILVGSIGIENSKVSKNATISVFIKSFFVANIMLLGMGFFVFATSSLSLINIQIVNHEFMFLFFIMFTLLGLYWLAIFPFNSWLMNATHVSDSVETICYLFWIMLPFGLKFILVLNESLPYLNYHYQTSVMLIVTFFALLSLFYNSFLNFKTKGIREFLTIILIGLNTPVVIYATLDPVYSSQSNMIFLLVYNVLIISCMNYIISSALSEKKSTLKLVDLKGLIKTKPVYSGMMIFLIFATMGFPLSGLFFGRVQFLQDALREDMAVPLALLLIGLTLIAVSMLRPLIQILSNESKNKYIIAWNCLDFYKLPFRVIFLVGVLIVGFIPEFLLKNL